MAEITVFPHGGRWAVAERGQQSPLQEYPTREAAEMAARSMAGGDAVEVVDDDPTRLGEGAAGDAGRSPDSAGADVAQPVANLEDPRATQGGL